MFYPNIGEEKSIDHINYLLKQFERQLKMLPEASAQQSVTVLGRMICEEMMQMLLKKQGFHDSKKRSTLHDNNETLYQNSIIPKECHDFLDLIRRYGNNSVNGIDISSRFVYSFLNAFNIFIKWFDSHYFQSVQKDFKIESCCVLIDSMEYDKINDSIVIDDEKRTLDNSMSKVQSFNTKKEILKLNGDLLSRQKELKKEEELKLSDRQENDYKSLSKSKSSEKSHSDNEHKLKLEIELLREELKEKEKIHQAQIKELLRELAEKDKNFETCINLLEQIKEDGMRIERKIDDLNSKIDDISNNIGAIKSFCGKQLKNIQSEEITESIIAVFVEECVDSIMKYYQNFKQNENYNIEKAKLTYSIGEDSWNKLCDKSKSFLITSKVMYDNLITMEGIVDYSGVCVLVTKALEVEAKKRFFTEFLDYLDEKYNGEYDKYHTALLYRNREPLHSEKFTMGDIAFAMCLKKNWDDTDEQNANNELRLMEYCRKCVFSRYDDDEIKLKLKRYASSIEKIRKKYRNPSAHTKEIERDHAEECFKMILDDELLKRMLDSFDT